MHSENVGKQDLPCDHADHRDTGVAWLFPSVQYQEPDLVQLLHSEARCKMQ